MRRKDKEVTDRAWIDEVLREAETISIGINGDDGWPYVVPMSFGYDGSVIYLHGAMTGKKPALLARDPRVCIQAYIPLGVIRTVDPKEYTYRYRSVTGFGRITVIDDPSEKNRALNEIMKHYDGPMLELPASTLGHTWAARIDIDRITGKQAPAPGKEY